MRSKIAFIGVGNMASAIISGITSESCKNPIKMSDIVLYDKFADKMNVYKAQGAVVADSESHATSLADCVFLCVKPQNFPELLPCLAGVENVSQKLFVTIAAGIPMQTVSDATGGAPTVRVLPNTPIFIGKAVSAICKTENVSDEDYSFVSGIFASSGSVLHIEESQMNRIIGVTSSSPAYVFLFIKSILEGAKAQALVGGADGLDEKLLIDAICDTVIGAAELAKASNKTLDEQISTVASKGGTTERALASLSARGFTEGIVDAMIKCTSRADELGGK